jgi:sugar lactone lactonase YvrE
MSFSLPLPNRITCYCILVLVICFSTFFSYAQLITTVAGGNGDGHQAQYADLVGTTTVAIDHAGNIYIAEPRRSVIRKIDAVTGVISTFAGNGKNGYSSYGIPALEASFGDPSGVAVDAQGNVYVSDQLTDKILKIDAVTGVLDVIAGNGSGGDGSLAVSASISTPHSLTLDVHGNIYFTDTRNYRIRKIDAVTKIITTVAGNGIAGSAGDNGPATQANIGFTSAVAVDANGNLYFTDYESHKIRHVNATTGIITTIAGTGTSGNSGDGGLATLAKLNSPLGVQVDSNGDLVISDTYNQRLRKIDHTTGIISNLAGAGVSGHADGVGVLAKFSVPQGITMDANGNLYVADYTNGRIRKISGASVTTIAGTGGFYGDGGPATDAHLKLPYGVALDKEGNLFIADMINSRIRKVDHVTKNITTICGGETNPLGDGSPAIGARVNWPRAVAFDKDDNLFIADTENQRIRKISKATGIITTVAGTGTSGGLGDGGLATAAQLSGPRDIAFDSEGNLFIADEYNHRVRKITMSTGVITTVAGTGTGGNSGDNGPATGAALNHPYSIATDSDNNLYISDLFNNKIRKVNASDQVITTIATLGNGPDGGPAIGGLNGSAPVIACDSLGDLVIYNGNQIRTISKTTGFVKTIAGKGMGYYGDGGSAVEAYFNSISDIIFDEDGNMFVADSGNDRIRKIHARTAQTIAFDTPDEKTYGNGNFDLSATSSSGLPVVFTSSNVNVATIVGKTVTIVGAGTATVTAHQPGDLVYFPASPVSKNLVVHKASQTITFDTPGEKTFGGAAFDLNATSSSGLAVTITSGTSTVATVNGKTVTIVGAGSTLLSVNQIGNNNYLPAATVEKTLLVKKASQTIAFNSIPAKAVGESPFSVLATASSGLAVAYSTSSDKITISGNQVTIVKAGLANVKADQGGNPNYDAAVSVERTFCVNPAKPSITFNFDLPNSELTLTSSENVGNQWYLNGVEIAGANQKTLITKSEGVFTVKSTVDGCAGPLSDPTAKLYTALSDPESPMLSIYPSPAKESLVVEVRTGRQEPFTLKLLDMAGRSVALQQGVTNESVIMNVSELPEGVYFLKVDTERKQVVKRFIKK